MASRRNKKLFHKLNLMKRSPSPQLLSQTPEPFLQPSSSLSRPHSRQLSFDARQLRPPLERPRSKKSQELIPSPPKDLKPTQTHQRNIKTRVIAKNLTYRKKSTHKRISTDVRLIPSPVPQDYTLSTSVSNSSEWKVSLPNHNSNSSEWKVSLPNHNPRPRLHPKRRVLSSITPDLRFTPDLYTARLDYFPSNLTSIANSPKIKTNRTNREIYQLEFTQSLHRNTVNWLLMQKDVLYSGSEDYTIKVTQFNGTKSTTLLGHRRGVTCLNYTDQMLWSGSKDQTIRFWKQGYTKHVAKGAHKGGVNTLWSPVTASLLSGGADRAIKLWDLNQFTVIDESSLYDSPITSLCASSTFTYISGWGNGALHIWDIRSGAPGEKFCAHNGTINQILSISDKNFLTVSSDNCARLWDPRSCHMVEEENLGEPVFSACQFQSRILLGTSQITQWQSDNDRDWKNITFHEGSIRAIAASRDRMVSGSFDKSIASWR